MWFIVTMVIFIIVDKIAYSKPSILDDVRGSSEDC